MDEAPGDRCTRGLWSQSSPDQQQPVWIVVAVVVGCVWPVPAAVFAGVWSRITVSFAKTSFFGVFTAFSSRFDPNPRL